MQLQDETLRVSPNCIQLRSKSLFCPQDISCKDSWNLGSKGKDPRAAAKHKMFAQSGASCSCKWLKRHTYEVRQHGKTQNENQDLSTSLLLFLLSLSSFAIRNFGIQVLYLSSFSLRGGERATQKFKFSPADRVPSPNPCTYKVVIFLSVSPHDHHWNANTCCDLYQHALLPQSSGSKTSRHAVPIKSNFSDKELARTGLIIGSGSLSFPSLGKLSEFSHFRERFSPFHISGTN